MTNHASPLDDSTPTPWEPWGTQMMLLRLSGADPKSILFALRTQGFLREPAVVQMKALQMAGFAIPELTSLATHLHPVLAAILRGLHAFEAPALRFGPNELEHLCAMEEEPGFSYADRLRFFMEAFHDNERLVMNLAARLCNWDPSRALANLVRNYGVDPHSLLLRARGRGQAERWKEQLGLPRWRTLGVPEWPWLPDTVPTWRKRQVPKDTLALLAPGDLAFEACRFDEGTPSIQALTLEIRHCRGLRRVGPLDVTNLVLEGNPDLEGLPEGLRVPGNLMIRDCPRLHVPPGLVVEGDLILEGSGQHLPPGLAVGGRTFLRPQISC